MNIAPFRARGYAGGMPQEAERILITGANGHLGQQLIARLCAEREPEAGGTEVRAVVRSQRAAETIIRRSFARPPDVRICDYADHDGIAEAAKGCRAIVHLVGIIKETRSARYEDAHEATCRVLADAATRAGVERIVYLSIFGATPESTNACLASKGRAESILLTGRVPTTVLRVPMVVGPEDYASAALRNEARSRLTFLVRGGATMQQPIDSRDVVNAILAAASDRASKMQCLDLGGPERLTHRALVGRAAKLYGRNPIVVPIPMLIATGFASLIEHLAANPPITPTMLEILQQDDRIDEDRSCQQLGITLTPLDETLAHYVGPESIEA